MPTAAHGRGCALAAPPVASPHPHRRPRAPPRAAACRPPKGFEAFKASLCDASGAKSRVDLVLACVDNYEARITINQVGGRVVGQRQGSGVQLGVQGFRGLGLGGSAAGFRSKLHPQGVDAAAHRSQCIIIVEPARLRGRVQHRALQRRARRAGLKRLHPPEVRFLLCGLHRGLCNVTTVCGAPPLCPDPSPAACSHPARHPPPSGLDLSCRATALAIALASRPACGRCAWSWSRRGWRAASARTQSRATSRRVRVCLLHA